MNIESLRKLVAASVTPVEFPGDQTINLRPLSAEDGIAFADFIAKLGYSDLSIQDKPEDLISVHCFLVSKSVVELQKKQWVKTIDSDEGRELLRNFSARKLMHLATTAMKISGMTGDIKKKSPPKKASSASSASPLDVLAPEP